MKGGILSAGLWLWLVAASSAAADTATFTHDANGNLTSRTEAGVAWVYVYDTHDQLREVRRDGVLFEVYWYDAQGRRVRKTSADGVVRYVWDGNQIVAETDDGGNTIARYHYAGDRLVSVDHVTEGTGFYLLDALGTPVGLVRADGAVAARYRLDAWGVLRTEEGDYPNPFRFTGHQFDEGMGLYYAKARYYDPQVGRFLSRDPAHGSIDSPSSLHRYAYTHNNPTAHVDPDGRDAVEVTASGESRLLSGHELYRILVQQEKLRPIEATKIVILSGLGADIGADKTAAMAPYIVASGELSKTLLLGAMATGASAGLAAGAASALGLGSLGTDALVGGASGLGAQVGEDVAAGELSPAQDYVLGAAGGAAGGYYGGKTVRGLMGGPRGAASRVIRPDAELSRGLGSGSGGWAEIASAEDLSLAIPKPVESHRLIVEGRDLSVASVPLESTRTAPSLVRQPLRGSANPRTRQASLRGTSLHADQPGNLPDQLRARYPETVFEFTRPGQSGQDVRVVGGRHPSEYAGSDWPSNVNHGDFKPDTAGGLRTFRSDQRSKWAEPTKMLPYDPKSGELKSARPQT